MIIEEKGLVKAIKAAYRHSGYTVLNQGGEVTIYTEGWFVRCLWTKLPRKALAIIVEHMGMIPDDGEAMAIEKDDQPQAVMAGIVSDDVAGWMGGEAASMASYVPVTFRGYQLFQEVNGRQAYAMYMAARASHKPVEFFKGLPPVEAMKLKNLVTGFLYGGDGEE